MPLSCSKCRGRRSLRRSWDAVLLLGICLSAGCGLGSGPNAESISVSGTVKLDGRPLDQGTLILMNDNGQGASAEIQPDGTYVLSCPPGTYGAAVTAPPAPDPLLQQAGAPAAPPEVKIPRPYQDFATSGLVADVKDGNELIDLELDSSFKGKRR